MIKKKIAMLGAFSVGKTSLVEQFVHSIFSERYLTTVGVRINKKELAVGGEAVTLLVWDIHGEDSIQEVSMRYLRGASGYLLVVDGTRENTLETARILRQRVRAEFGELPFIALFNKSDLEQEWVIDDGVRDALREQGWKIMDTSAKTGLNVEQAFSELTRLMLAQGS
jgi:small GTP-binding protein